MITPAQVDDLLTAAEGLQKELGLCLGELKSLPVQHPERAALIRTCHVLRLHGLLVKVVAELAHEATKISG